jgi:hypothetical protein
MGGRADVRHRTTVASRDACVTTSALTAGRCGKTVTGFTNGEEEAVGLTKVVPFLMEAELPFGRWKPSLARNP